MAKLHRRLAVGLLIVPMLISSCSPRAIDCSDKKVFCAGFVTDTEGLNDYGMNQDTWAGIQQSKEQELVDQIAYIESVNVRDYEKNIAYFVEAGYDIIVTSGGRMRDATLHSADLYPASVFIGMDQPDEASRPNFISVTFPEDQMGFFAGALAAYLTTTKAVGAVCETSGIDAMWRYCEGFRSGAKYVDEAVTPVILYHDGFGSDRLFIDEEWGSESAQSLILNENIDVLFAAGGDTAVGALRAASQERVPAIGAERDQTMALNSKNPYVLTSVLGNARLTIQELIQCAKTGNMEDAEGSAIRYIPFDSAASQSLTAEMDEILAGLRSGKIETNVAAAKP
jgi:basic membrane protein A and related proteins